MGIVEENKKLNPTTFDDLILAHINAAAKKEASRVFDEKFSKLLDQLNSSIPKDELLSRKDAAKLLGVSTVTLDTWVRNGMIKRHTMPGGRRKFFKPSELYEALEKG